MAKKKTVKREPSVKLSASHIMLYIVLGVYIFVALAGVAFVGLCVASGSYESGAQGLITVGSIIGACSCTVVGFYSTKAAKENEIKLSNDKYRMRLELAKEIFKEYGNSLDDRSVDLLQKLMSDKDISEISPASSPPDWSANSISGADVTGVITGYSNINDSEEGLG